MSIMDLFRGKAPEQTQVTNPAATTAPGLNSNAPAPDNSVQQQQQAEADANKDPLDQFKELWNAPKEGEPVAQKFDPSNLFQIDPAKIQAEVGKINFTQVVTPEIAGRIAGGGEEAVKATLEAMNATSQMTFMQAMLASSKMIEGALTKANDSLDSRIEQRAKQLQVSNTLREANPALSHPAVAPLVTAMETQFAQKFPNATQAELTKMAQEYVAKAGAAFGGKPDATESNAGNHQSGEVDWEKYLTNGS